MLGKGGNGKGIVSMTEREKMRRLAPLRQVEAYWQGLCDGDSVPLRSQIDPRGIENALENAFLMERIAQTMAKIRVAGTHLNELMGMQVAGMPLSSLIAPTERERFGQGVASLFADPAIIHIDLVAEGGFGKPEMEASMVLLPLRSDFGDLTRGMGALITHGRIGRTPRRFLIQRMNVVPALKGAPKGSDDAASGIIARQRIDLDKTPAVGFREDSTPFGQKPRNTPVAVSMKPLRSLSGGAAQAQDDGKGPSRGGYLRLVVDND